MFDTCHCCDEFNADYLLANKPHCQSCAAKWIEKAGEYVANSIREHHMAKPLVLNEALRIPAEMAWLPEGIEIEWMPSKNE